MVVFLFSLAVFSGCTGEEIQGSVDKDPKQLIEDEEQPDEGKIPDDPYKEEPPVDRGRIWSGSLLIILTNEASLNSKEYHIRDFPEVFGSGTIGRDPRAEDPHFTRWVHNLVQEQLEAQETGDWSSHLQIRKNAGGLVDLERYRRLIGLSFHPKSEEELYELAWLLEQREDIEEAIVAYMTDPNPFSLQYFHGFDAEREMQSKLDFFYSRRLSEWYRASYYAIDYNWNHFSNFLHIRNYYGTFNGYPVIERQHLSSPDGWPRFQTLVWCPGKREFYTLEEAGGMLSRGDIENIRILGGR